jgi:DNA-binding XRE family transcriptional regulator
MITGPQLRAARGLLDWTRTELAEAAKISPETVKNIEHGTFRPQEQTAQAIYAAFAQHDVVFTENEGVQIKKDAVKRFEGAEGFKRFMDDVYEVAKQDTSKNEKPIYISNVDDRLFIKHLGDYFTMHVRRMNEIKDLTMHILIQDKPYSFSSEESRGHSYREYRRHPEQAIGNVPFYVYGDKLGILMFEGENPPQIVVISSSLVSKAYREQFGVLWKTAKPLEKAKGQ